MDYDGNVFTFGKNNNRKIGGGVDGLYINYIHISKKWIFLLASKFFVDNIRGLKCGDYHTFVLDSSGYVLSCDGIEVNQLGRENNKNWMWMAAFYVYWCQ